MVAAVRALFNLSNIFFLPMFLCVDGLLSDRPPVAPSRFCGRFYQILLSQQRRQGVLMTKPKLLRQPKGEEGGLALPTQYWNKDNVNNCHSWPAFPTPGVDF